MARWRGALAALFRRSMDTNPFDRLCEPEAWNDWLIGFYAICGVLLRRAS